MGMHQRHYVYFALVIFTVAGIAFTAAAHEMPDFTGQIFPADHALNTRIDSLPVHPNSENFITSIGAATSFHPDFGTAWEDGGTLYQMGIPYNVVGADQPKVPINWTLYGDESDPGPWPIPNNPNIETVFDWREEGDGDRHMLIVDRSSGMLYETGNVTGNADGTVWEGGCGAVFDLTSNKLRTDTWTSADAAGLPIFPLLIRYDEVERALENGGEIPHAIRFTVQRSRKAYLWPARHYASSSTDNNRPPMGLRFRLKAAYDIAGYSPRMQVILRTFKKYGIIVADNGSNWYFQGTHDDRWDDEEINSLKQLKGNNFEAVDISEWLRRPGFDTGSAAVPPASAVTGGAIQRAAIAGGMTADQLLRQGGGPSIAVTYYLPMSTLVELPVTTLQGTAVFPPVRGRKSAGEHTVRFSRGTLQTGTYLVRLLTEQGYGETGRFIVVR